MLTVWSVDSATLQPLQYISLCSEQAEGDVL